MKYVFMYIIIICSDNYVEDNLQKHLVLGT